MPLARRSASAIASSSLEYCQYRQPPAAGPNLVEWIAMTQSKPTSGSVKRTTCSKFGSGSSLRASMRTTPNSATTVIDFLRDFFAFTFGIRHILHDLCFMTAEAGRLMHNGLDTIDLKLLRVL